MKCKYCKRQIPDESIYCMFCGEKVIKSKKKKAEVKVPKPRQLPSGSWFAQLTVNGERVSVSAATEAEYYTKAKAVKLGLIKAEKRAPALSLGKAIDDYIDSKRNVLSPSTILGYVRMRKGRFQAYSDKDIHTINWQQAVNDEARLCSAKTLKNAWSLIAASVKFATGMAPSDVRLPQVVSNEHPYLEPDQIPVFINGLEGEPCKLPALLALNGLRQSELLALTWDNVDLQRQQLHIAGAMVYSDEGLVHKDTNKNTSSRRAVKIMLPELQNELEAVEDKTGFVTHISTSGLYKGINRVCRNCGLPEVGVHGLRHSFASLCYHLQIPDMVAMQFGGWSDRETLSRVYTHIPQKDLDKNADKIIDFFQIANEKTNEIKKA